MASTIFVSFRTTLASTSAASLLSSSFFLSLSFPFASFGVGRLNTTLRCTLVFAPIDPASGVGTLTTGAVALNPRWNVDGSTRPGGCWNGHAARVQPAPKRHCWLKWLFGVPEPLGIDEDDCDGWVNGQPLDMRVHASPYRQGILDGLGSGLCAV